MISRACGNPAVCIYKSMGTYMVKYSTVNVLKFQTPLSFCSQIKYGILGLKFTKSLSEKQTGKTPIRLLLQSSKKQSSLSPVCLGFFGRQQVFEIFDLVYSIIVVTLF